MIEKPTHPNFKDIEGQEFDRWKVISYAGSDNGAKWLCECRCGTVRIVATTNLTQGSSSCGCKQKEAASETGKTLYLRRRKFPSPNKTHGMSKTPEYLAWNQMIQRCTNPNIRNYSSYGGRGIFVDPNWLTDFKAFFDHIGSRPSPRHSLDRIDNNGNYVPGNVRWSTDSQQMDNTRRQKRFAYQGEMLSIKEISRRSGATYVTLYHRLVKLGWTTELALATPVRTKRCKPKSSN